MANVAADLLGETKKRNVAADLLGGGKKPAAKSKPKSDNKFKPSAKREKASAGKVIAKRVLAKSKAGKSAKSKAQLGKTRGAYGPRPSYADDATVKFIKKAPVVREGTSRAKIIEIIGKAGTWKKFRQMKEKAGLGADPGGYINVLIKGGFVKIK